MSVTTNFVLWKDNLLSATTSTTTSTTLISHHELVDVDQYERPYELMIAEAI